MAEELSTTVSKWLIARESTYGTDEIDLANNLTTARKYAYLDQASRITPNVETRERAGTRPSFDSTRSIHVARNLAVSVSGEVIASSDPGQAGGEYPLDMSDFMIAAGMTETIVSTTSATYATTTELPAGLTIYCYRRYLDAAQTWQFIYATGVRGDFSMSANVGEIATWSFEGESNNFPENSGVTANPHGWSVDLAFFDTDGTILLDKNGASIVYTGTETVHDPNPMYFEGGTCTIDGTTYELDSFTISHNNNVSARLEGTASPIASVVRIGGRSVTLELGLTTTGAGYEKALDKCLDDAEVSGTIVLTDRTGSGGSTLTITMGKLQYRFPTEREIDGFAGWTLPLQANGDWATAQVGDNDITYAWTVTA